MEKVNADNLFKYTREEDIANVLTHGLGAVLSLLALIYLLVNYGGQSLAITLSIIVYCLSMFALFSASSMYHYVMQPQMRAKLKRLDHAMILVMISGTYAPFCVKIATTESYIILALVYVMSIIGIMLKVRYINVSSKISILIYISVGWLAVFMLPQIVELLTPQILMLLVAGGVTYTLGAILYAFTSFKYHHAIWHVIVLIAAIIFFIAINLTLAV